jgi:hypothetical protein
MSIRNVLAIGIGTYLGGIALFGQADTASAAFRRVHSSQCHYTYDDAGSDLYNGMVFAPGTIGRSVYCPAPSDSELPHSATVTLNVHGYSPSTTAAYSEACAKAYNTSASTYGTFKYWAAGYDGVYGVSVAPWSDDTAMPLVYSFLPAGSQLFGFFMST